MAALPSRGSSKAGPTPTNTQPANALLFPVDEDLLTRIRSLFLSRNGDRTPKTPNSSPQGTFQGISVPAKTFSPTRQSKIIQVQDLQKDPEATDQDKNSAHSRPRSPGYTAAQATRRVSTAYGVKNSPSSTGYQSPINARTEGQPYPRKSSLTWSGSRQPSITSPIVGVSNKVSRQGSKSTIYSKGRADEASVAVFPAVERKAVVKEAEAEAVLPSIPSTVFLPSPKVPDIPVEHGSSIPEPGKPHQERMGNLRAEFQDAKQDEETIVARDGIPDKIKSSLFPPRAASVHSGKSVETVRSDHSSVFKPSSSALEAASPIPPVFAAEWSAIKPCIPGPPVLKSLKPQKERASSAQTHTARGMQDRVPQDGQSILVEGQGLEQPKRDDNMQEGRDHSINASKLAEQKSPWPPQSPVSEGTDFTQKTMRSSLSRMVIRNPGEGANDFGDNPTSRRSSDSPSFSKLRGMSRGLDQTSPAAAPKTPPPPKTPSSSGSDSWWFQQCRRILAMEAGSPWPSVPSPQPSHGTRLMKNEATPLPHHVASSAPSDHEQDHLDDRRLSKSLNQAINGLEALLSEAIQVAEQAADEKDAVGAEVVLREAQSVRDDAFARLHFEPPASTEKGSPVQAETRLAQKHDSNLSGLWTPGRKSSLGAPALSAQLASRRPSAVPPSTTESNTTFPVANSARPRTYTVDTRDPEKGQESSYPLFRPARTRTPYPGNSPVTSRRESHLVDPFSTEDSRDTRSTSSSLSSDFSADVEDNVTVPARRSSRPHQDFVAKPNALSNGLVTPDRRPLMNSDDSSVISSFPKPLRVNEDTRHIDWHAVSDRRPSKVPPGKVLRPGHDRRKSSIARAAWWVPRGTPAGGTTRPSAFRELVDRFSISGRGGFSAAVRASNHDGLAATPIPSEDIALRRLSEVPELGSERTKEPTEIGDVDTDAAPPPQESKFSRSRFSLRDRRHVSFRGHHHRLSFRRLHRPHPIARDWSVTRKRFVASVACINTAFVGLIVGIYAGEVPRIQYQIVDLNGRVILGNVLFYIGLAISTFCAWTLPLLHGRKPYVLGSLAILLPLQLPQALAIGTPRSPYVATYLVAVLLARATSGFILGFAQVNFVTTLLDVFGPSLQSSNPHGDLVSGHGGGGMGIWLSIWSWCFLGSVGTGFFIGGGIISNLNAAWGFQLIIVLGSIILLFNILVPEVRRSPYRRTISEIRSGNGEVSERLARGEVMMDLYSTGPIWCS
ncbi:MAG: hypothetical protein M1823_000894 [Watsoniomyces obsoletus]|nr:MAG: hypothetical protein M1823_000894 [Watsoniomyces obsoletus]